MKKEAGVSQSRRINAVFYYHIQQDSDRNRVTLNGTRGEQFHIDILEHDVVRILMILNNGKPRSPVTWSLSNNNNNMNHSGSVGDCVSPIIRNDISLKSSKRFSLPTFKLELDDKNLSFTIKTKELMLQVKYTNHFTTHPVTNAGTISLSWYYISQKFK